MRVALLGSGEAATVLDEPLSTTVVPDDVSCTELMRSWNIWRRWAVVGVFISTSSSSPFLACWWQFCSSYGLIFLRKNEPTELTERSLSLRFFPLCPSLMLPLVLFSFSSTVADGVRRDEDRLTATGFGPPWFSAVPLPSLVVNRGMGFGATKGWNNGQKCKLIGFQPNKWEIFTLAKMLSSETGFRGWGVGTVVLTTLASSLRWLKGPRIIC